MNRNWLYVLVAGLVEIIWVIGLSHSNSIWEWFGTAIAIIISFYLIIESAKRLPVGTVYAVFTGIGTAGTVTTEMLLFGEPFKIIKVILIAILLSGVIGLKLVTDDSAGQDQEVTN